MIYFFSGTGNSQWVAQQLSTNLGLDLTKITEVETFSVTDDEPLGFVFPIYSWGPPPLVMDFIDKLAFTGSHRPYTFMVCTCGDDVGQTVNILHKRLTTKGFTLDAAFSVQMPNTYVCLPGFDVDSDARREQKLAAAPARLQYITEKLTAKESITNVVEGSFPWLKSRVIRPVFLRNLNDKAFQADAERCISCGRCVRSCPLGNISLIDQETPQWHGHCTQCLSCYHHCPTHAINYGKGTLNKGQYYYHS